MHKTERLARHIYALTAPLKDVSHEEYEGTAVGVLINLVQAQRAPFQGETWMDLCYQLAGVERDHGVDVNTIRATVSRTAGDCSISWHTAGYGTPDGMPVCTNLVELVAACKKDTQAGRSTVPDWAIAAHEALAVDWAKHADVLGFAPVYMCHPQGVEWGTFFAPTRNWLAQELASQGR